MVYRGEQYLVNFGSSSLSSFSGYGFAFVDYFGRLLIFEFSNQSNQKIT